MEKEISDIYSEAQSDITKKWDAYMKRGEERLSTLRNAYVNASPETAKEAKKAYEDAVRNYTLRNDQYKELVDETTLRLANVNKTALAYANGEIPEIYAKNYAQIGEDLSGLKIDFKGKSGEGIRQLVNEDAVKRRILEGDVKTPFMRTQKFLDIPKDQRWNTKQINSSVLQGILQGESMDKIAKRLLPIVDNNSKASIRNARTLVTGAENAGRKDSYERLEDEGLVMKKVWIATPDDRTREAHLAMDGQEVDVDESFVDGDGNELDYPGDPSGEPETVYNCRCGMRTHIIGFRRADGSISEIDYEREQSAHERAIEEEKERRQVDEVGEADVNMPKFDGADAWLERLQNNDEKYFNGLTDEWLKTITKDERQAINMYTGSAYRQMNSYLRGLTDKIDDRHMQAIEECTSALNKASLPKEVIVRRGSDFDSLLSMTGIDKETMIQAMDTGDFSFIQGMIASDKGFLSTTPFVEGGFTDDVDFIIGLPEGANAMYIDSISRFKGEMELLVNQDSHYYMHELMFDEDNAKFTVFMSMI